MTASFCTGALKIGSEINRGGRGSNGLQPIGKMSVWIPSIPVIRQIIKQAARGSQATAQVT